MDFIQIRFLDILDIFLVAFLFYQVYMLIRGTVAINIVSGIAATYLIWLFVKALNMELLGSILGQVMGVGVIAIMIVFQQEIRKFLLMIGTRYFSNSNFTWANLLGIFGKGEQELSKVRIYPILNAVSSMASTKTGALIVIAQKSDLTAYAETGQSLAAETSQRLLESIFFKNSPLHDGAVIIQDEKIRAASCVLPVSQDQSLPKHLGLRHRAALGISEISDAFIIIVSEETGYISYTSNGRIKTNIQANDLRRLMEETFEVKKLEKAPALAD